MTTKNILNSKAIYFLLLTGLTTACNSKTETINGTDTTAFRISREVMEKTLSDNEKETLEKALRVMVLAAMDDKFNDTTATDLTLDDLVMKKTNAKNYDEIVETAELYLKAKNEKSKNETKAEIKELFDRKHTTDSLVAILNTLKGTFVKADLDDNGYLTFYCEFANNSKEYINTYGIGMTAQLLQEEGIFVSCANVYIGAEEIAPGGKVEYNCAMAYMYQQARQEYKKTSWDNIKLPITDLKAVEKYFNVNVYTDRLVLNDIDYQLLGNAFDEDDEQKLKGLQEELKALEETKSSLDELQLN